MSAPYCVRSGTDIRLAFADRRGRTHTVDHTTYYGCYDRYHTGDHVRLRYLPADPQALLIQPEIDDLPIALIFPFGTGDFIFIGGGAMLLAYLLSERVSGLMPWLSSSSRRPLRPGSRAT
jgi:hypothetical protein